MTRRFPPPWSIDELEACFLPNKRTEPSGAGQLTASSAGSENGAIFQITLPIKLAREPSPEALPTEP